MKEEAKWYLLDRIQENTEAWENDKGRKSGINYDYECIESFMGTNDFQNIRMLMVLICKLLRLALELLLLILKFQKGDGINTMHLTKILLTMPLLEVLSIASSTLSYLNLISKRFPSQIR